MGVIVQIVCAKQIQIKVCISFDQYSFGNHLLCQMPVNKAALSKVFENASVLTLKMTSSKPEGKKNTHKLSSFFPNRFSVSYPN